MNWPTTTDETQTSAAEVSTEIRLMCTDETG
jgi:hypothetical protein